MQLHRSDRTTQEWSATWPRNGKGETDRQAESYQGFDDGVVRRQLSGGRGQDDKDRGKMAPKESTLEGLSMCDSAHGRQMNDR